MRGYGRGGPSPSGHPRSGVREYYVPSRSAPTDDPGCRLGSPVIGEAETKIEEKPMFDRVGVGVDGRAGGRDAIALGRQLARSPRPMVLAHVYGSTPVAGVAGTQSQRAHHLLACAREENVLSSRMVVRGDTSPGRGLHRLAGHERGGPVGGRLLAPRRSGAGDSPCPLLVMPRCVSVREHDEFDEPSPGLRVPVGPAS